VFLISLAVNNKNNKKKYNSINYSITTAVATTTALLTVSSY